MKGKVIRFNNNRGFGFIRPDGSEDDVFFYYNVIQMDGFKTVRVGQEVEFETETTEKGLRATVVKPLE